MDNLVNKIGMVIILPRHKLGVVLITNHVYAVPYPISMPSRIFLVRKIHATTSLSFSLCAAHFVAVVVRCSSLLQSLYSHEY